MMAESGLGKKRILEFLVLLGIAAICLYFVVMMLMNAHPHIAPAVKNGGASTSSLVSPVNPGGRFTYSPAPGQRA